MEDSYFIKLSRPRKLQKHVLLSSKLLLEVTKSQLALKELTSKKQKLKETIASQASDITLMVQKLQNALPHAELLSEFEPVEKKKHHTRSPKPNFAKRTQEPSSDVDKLNQAIKAIEEKLARLD